MSSVPVPLFKTAIANAPRFPPRLRACVQACLTRFWTQHLPFHAHSPAGLAARVLEEQLGDRLGQYTYVDFCAGAGGPTPIIERGVNEILRQRARSERSSLVGNDAANESGSASTASDASPGTAILRKTRPKAQTTVPIHGLDHIKTSSMDNANTSNVGSGEDTKGAHFILTDIRPPLNHWSLLPRTSPTGHLHYIPHSIDASAAPSPRFLLSLAKPPIAPPGSTNTNTKTTSFAPKPSLQPQPKIFRLYSLAFHHFTDPLALAILKDTLHHSAGFAIFELQSRSLDSLLLCSVLFPFLWLASWLWFGLLGPDWTHLFWTYVVPVVPVVIVFDGWVSCLRTRTTGEVRDLVRLAAAAEGKGGAGGDGDRGSTGVGKGVGEGEGEEGWKGWRFESGSALYAWPIGRLEWFVGIRDDHNDDAAATAARR